MTEEIKTLGDVGAGHTLGRYELLVPVATGGMAVVWAARLRGTRGFQKLVAVKTIRSEMSEDPQFEQMFLDEATLAARIRHPHVVEILDLGEVKKTLFIVMEWIDGEPLNAVMRVAADKGGIPLPVAVRIATQMCAGLHAAHELRDDGGKLYGVVHRDVSPQNIMVTYDGVAKLVDFGVAKARGQMSETQAGQIKGKVAYMAPEQARGGIIDRRTDVFAMGIVLYTITTGRHPFRRENDMATMMNICSDERVFRPSKVMPGYPPKLETVVLQALEKDPAKRFPTANDMLRALDQALPASARVSTDHDVATFLKALLGDRQDKRSAAIRAALQLADERSDATKAMRPLRPSPDASSTLTPLSAVAASDVLNAGTNPGGTDPKSERWTFSAGATEVSQPTAATGPSLVQSVESGPLLAPLDISRASEPRRTIAPATWIALVALVVAGAAVGGMVLAFRSRPPAPSAATLTALPPTAPSAASAAPAPTPTPTPEASSVAEPPPSASAPEHESNPSSTAASAAQGAAPTGPRPHPAAVPTTPKTAPTSPAAAPANTKALPQVRNPGF